MQIQLRATMSALVALALSSVQASAQARAGSISGIVQDERARPLDQATVVLDPSDTARMVLTNASGRFRIGGVSTATHTLRVVRVGYVPEERTFSVPPEGIVLTIVMHRITELDTVPVRAARLGIYGTVITRDASPIADASVDIMGGRASAKTTATGRFELPGVKEGAYLVYIRRKGYNSRVLSVVVPRDGGAKLAVALDTLSGPSFDKRLSMPLSEFDSRARARGRLSAVIPRQEFSGRYGMSLKDALRFTASFLKSGLVISDDTTCVFVDGLPKPGLTLNAFSAGEVLAVEVYGLGQDHTNTLMDRWPARMPCGNGEYSPPASSRKFGLQPGTARPFGTVIQGMKPTVPRPSTSREPMDNIARAVVIWLKR
jgi:carboxypeptidase family protein